MLAGDLPIAEFEEDRDVGAKLGVGGKNIARHRQEPAPVAFEGDVVAVDNRIQYIEALSANHLLSFARGCEQSVEIAVLADRRQPVRKLLLYNVAGEKIRQRTTLSAVLQRFEVAACDCEIVGRCDRHAFPGYDESCGSSFDGTNVRHVTNWVSNPIYGSALRLSSA